MRFFASGSFLQVIGDSLGVDKSTVSRTVRDVSVALNRRQHQFIKWPSNDEFDRMKNNFFLRTGFPSVIGCADCTHVRIQALHSNENNYVNRKDTSRLTFKEFVITKVLNCTEKFLIINSLYQQFKLNKFAILEKYPLRVEDTGGENQKFFT